MYVYLIGHKTNVTIHTYIGITDDFEKRLKEHNVGCKWFPLIVLETPASLANSIQNEWRRVNNVEEKVKFGFLYTKQYYLTAYVADIKIGLLKEMPPGKIKVLEKSFWDSL